MQIPLEPKKRSRIPFFLATVLVAGFFGFLLWYVASPRTFATSGGLSHLREWFADPSQYEAWQVRAGERCPAAPMLLPTTGYIGVDYGDSFRPGHQHSGYDIFSPDGQENFTSVVAAYDGYLTREAHWLSAVIIRHPDFPEVVPGEQIWTYYTHMASSDGATSYISADFPPGTKEQFIEAGTVLGYQGTWSGDPNRPTGLHLHFSVVKTARGGGFANETKIENTYDPRPFLGLIKRPDGVLVCP